jgi:hypothetical protein
MRLAPRQLQRSGMTGNVPYYGGRLAPAQAYAVGHTPPQPPQPPQPAEPAEPPSRLATPANPQQTMTSLRQLRDDGLLSETEFTDLVARLST